LTLIPFKTPIGIRQSSQDPKELQLTYELINQIYDENKREEIYKKLNDRRQNEPEIASIIWYSPGIVAILLQEIIESYQFLNDNQKLSQRSSENICNVLGLF